MKRLDLDRLAHEVRRAQAAGKTVVLCHGVFDLLHIGHIRYLRAAKEHGDLLVVTVTPDEYVDKGPGRPAFNQDLRVEGLAALDCVDYVAVNRWPTAEETLRLLRPNYYAKGSEFRDPGSDMTGKIGREARVAREVGTELVFTDEIVFSSSNLINRYLSTFPDETKEYLSIFRSRYSQEEIFSLLDRMADLKVLVIGDAIIDEYQYCSALGISSKDPTLAVRYESQDTFAGGVLAVANHVASFAGRVQLVTLLGEYDRQEKFIRSHLRENIVPFFITQPGAPTVVKRRFVDGYSFTKLMEVYVMDDAGLPADEDRELGEWLAEQLPGYDLVIAADFGHGAISESLCRVLEEHAPFLAVNTQANAGNRGFHTINRYQRADLACLAAHEIRLAYHARSGNERVLAERTGHRLGCRYCIVTLGRRGCLVWEPGNIIQAPALAQDVVDRVGAGDTLFAVAAMAARLAAPAEIIAFLGNVVGAEAVRTIGNLRPVDPLGVKKHVTAILK